MAALQIGTALTTPHSLNDKYETLSVSTLNECPHVIVVGLDRPRKRNAINAKMWREIGDLFSRLGTRGDGCRCVLLLGNGKNFSSGLDVSDTSLMMSDSESKTADTARKAIAFRAQIIEMQKCFTAVESCPVPVVAAIHGSCIGAGVDLVCCADVRLCEEGTWFSVREVRLGLAADIGTLQRLPTIVGNGSWVRQVCLTGEDWNAATGARMGFVSYNPSPNPNELMVKALGLCRKIALNSPVAVVGTKLSINYSRDRAVSEGLEHIAAHNSAALMTDDLVSSFMAASSKTQATFDDMLPHSKL